MLQKPPGLRSASIADCLARLRRRLGGKCLAAANPGRAHRECLGKMDEIGGAAGSEPPMPRCDAEGLPAYLESSKERNVPYYERFGFRVTRELAMPGRGCPPVWLMWRDPNSG